MKIISATDSVALQKMACSLMVLKVITTCGSDYLIKADFIPPI